MGRTLSLLAAFVALGGCGDDTPVAEDGGGPADAAAPEPVACGETDDCDDGLYCNGVERCVDGFCVAENVPDCDDGIECTVDSCSEERRECVSAAPDADGDGVGDRRCLGADGIPIGTDCDDGDANRFPGNPEICDADDRDEDCDPLTVGTVDEDRDGQSSNVCCNYAADGAKRCGRDCDDTRTEVFADAPELCDDLDNDCDSIVDENLSNFRFGVDCDRDGFGVPTEPAVVDCSAPPEPPSCPDGVWVTNTNDCDDTLAIRNPALFEVCDGIDNNCNETVDEGLLFRDFYPDCDGDGEGDDAAAATRACAEPEPLMCGGGWSRTSADCDDSNGDIAGGRVEVCDGLDNNCNGGIDESLPVLSYWPDCDGDSYGDRSVPPTAGCGPPESAPTCGDGISGAWVLNQSDCDDASAAINIDATEVCDYVDNDCDGTVDVNSGGVTMRVEGRFDRDRDGSGGAAERVECPDRDQFAPGRSAPVDCDDRDPDTFPGQSAYFIEPRRFVCPDSVYDRLCPDQPGFCTKEGFIRISPTLPPISVSNCTLDPADVIPATPNWDYDCDGSDSPPPGDACTCIVPPTQSGCQGGFSGSSACGQDAEFYNCDTTMRLCHPRLIALNMCFTLNVETRTLPCH